MIKTIIFTSITGLVLLAGGAWLFMGEGFSTIPSGTKGGDGFAESADKEQAPNFYPEATGTEGERIASSSSPRSQKIFKIADGPIAGATFVQTLRPTTTLARFVKANNGHVQDIVLDSSGAVPRAVSNTTIPGVERVMWGEAGGTAIVQYIDGNTIKTARLAFPISTSTSSTLARGVRLQFFPDGIAELAVSPNGQKVAYLLRAASGVDGYTAQSDGTGSKKVFSLPLSEILLSWPAQTTILAQTKAAARTPGIVFSINAENGNVVPLLQAPGVTANADRSFSHIVYQTIGTDRTTFLRDMKRGADMPLSFDPIPEKCAWSTTDTVTLYCATPYSYVAPEYLDQWHQGTASVPDTIFSYNALSGKSAVLASPGGSDGGVSSDVIELKNSADGKYLLFITKGDRALWGVRLGPNQ